MMSNLSCEPKKKPSKPSVFKCNATYYNPVTQRWQAGTFKLHRSHVEFLTENSDEETKNPFHLSLPLATLSSIEKRMSSFLFAAVVIRVSSETHWFASFPNRNAAFNNLELFWKDSLLTKKFNCKLNSSKLDSSQSSPIGKELLGVLYKSEKHLVNAASALEEQSMQLYEVEESVVDMNGDLSIAEKQINALNLWPTKAPDCLPQPIENTPATEEKKVELPKRKYCVTFSPEKSIDSYNDWERGTLVVTSDIALFDEKDHLRMSFPSTELKYLKVISPWELCIIKGNEEETVCYIMCPMLSRVLRFFATIPSINDKVVYVDDENDALTNSCSSCSSSLSVASTSSTPSTPNLSWNLPDLPLLTERVEKVRSSGYLTDEEIQEISSKLTDLHGLATEVAREKQAQMERITSLIHDVEKTDTRVNQDTKKLRKLA